MEGGYLIVSPTEVSTRRFTQFRSANLQGVTFYIKEGQEKKTAPKELPLSFQTQTAEQLSEFTPMHPPPSFPDQKRSSPAEEAKKEFRVRGSFFRAEMLYNKGELQSAINELLHCDQSISVIYLLTKAYADSGEFSTALLWCNKLIENDRLGAQNYYLKATILQEMQNLQEAQEALRKTIFIDPYFILAHFNLANMLRETTPPEASVYYRNAKEQLKKLPYDSILPESDGLPAGRLLELIEIIEREV
ncbi:Chemotaxis protein methyltransferase CheR [Chitinispirillum alkaliphilum]|nr:Chemotaxis protein methyltransferase CheR [Chitinispirillum alkaliphilum]